MMDAFPYQPIEVDPSFADPSRTLWRPMLPVRIFGPEKRLDAIGLVDTGASETLLPLDFWEEIDPVFREGEVGILEAANGTEIEVRYATVDLAIRLGRDVFRWHAKVGFTPDREEMVLGDAGFLRHFIIRCDRANRTLGVRRAGLLPPDLMKGVPTGPMPRPFHVRVPAPAGTRRRNG